MLDEADYEREDAAPIDMLESYFSAHGWELSAPAAWCRH